MSGIKRVRYRTGVVYAVLAAFSYAAFDMSVRFYKPWLNAWEMMLGRSIFGVILVVVLARWTGVDLMGKNRIFLLVTGLIGTLGILCLMAALLLLTLFEALALLYLFPAFAAIFSPWVTNEKLEFSGWICIVIAFIGTLLIIWTGYVGGGLKWGHLLGLASGMCYGLTITLIRRLRSDNNPLTPFFYLSAVGAVVCVGPVLAQTKHLEIGLPGISGVIAIGALGACALLCSNKALGALPSPQVGVIGMIEVPLGALGGLIFFGERLNWQLLFGAGLILVSSVWLHFLPSKQPPLGIKNTP